MALAQTDLAELKRFTFFVSRRFEEGRERFRLHMGYFATLAEAEEWLTVVREMYPGAWAGEAPGKKLRERAAAAQAAQAQHAAGPQAGAARPAREPVAAAPAPKPPAAPPPAPQPPPGLSPLDAALSMRVPVLKAAAPAASRAASAEPFQLTPDPPAAPAPRKAPAAPAPANVQRKPAPAAAPAPRTQPAAPSPTARAPSKPPVAAAAVPSAATVKPAAAPAAAMPAATPRTRPPAPPPAPPKASAAAAPIETERSDRSKGVFGDSNVREVLKALGDASATGETRLMRAPSPPAPKDAAPAPKNPLSDTQVLKLLETRRPEGSEAPAADATHGAIPLLKPDDTGTREALKEAVTSDAPVLFAVQLQWSVQPVELDKVPPLAIFSAYTLYTVEGSRDGRKWFGLRLGFFSDAISAKQVAHYVRSEFASVAVVPVSAQEKVRATDQDKQAATVGGPVARPGQPAEEFKLLDDDTARTEVAKLRAAAAANPGHAAPAPAAAAVAAAKAAPVAAVKAAPAAAAKPLTDVAGRALPGRPIPKVAVGRAVTQAPATPAPAGARARGRTPGKVAAGEKRGAQSLEETLEILGASQLTIDNGRGETLNESGVRHLRVEVQKNSPFSKLLERLSERMKKQ
jgi:hypothetical protein